MELFKKRSFLYDYRLSDGTSAWKPYQVIELTGINYSEQEIIEMVLLSLPKVTPLSICEINQSVTLDEIEECAQVDNELPFRPIFINLEELKKEAQSIADYKTTKKEKDGLN